MTKLKASALGVLLSLCVLASSAQEQKLPLNEPDRNKPSLFADLPSKMSLNLSSLQSLLDLPVGSNVSVSVSEALVLDGTVVSSAQAPDGSSKSVVVRSRNRPGATFTFSRITRGEGSAGYTGRLMSRGHSDLFEIVQENGTYYLQKKNLEDVLSE